MRPDDVSVTGPRASPSGSGMVQTTSTGFGLGTWAGVRDTAATLAPTPVYDIFLFIVFMLDGINSTCY